MSIKMRIYLDPNDKLKFEELMVTHGYIPDRRLSRMSSIFIEELLSEPLHITRPLRTAQARHYRGNAIDLTLPSNLEKLPAVYNLPDWSSLVANIADGSLRPEKYPTCLIPRTDAAITNHIYATNSQIYVGLSAVDQDILDRQLMPILSPTLYVDNRPNIPSFTTPILSTPQRKDMRYAWYVPDLTRKSERITITVETRERILDLSEHFYILHPARQTEVSRIITTLEALYVRLLVPAT